jgi:hypothetical protein
VLALLVALNLNPEVSKPTIKLILSRRNVQPMAHAAHSLFWAMSSRWTNLGFFLKSLNARQRPWACSRRRRGTRILAYSGVVHIKPITAFLRTPAIAAPSSDDEIRLRGTPGYKAALTFIVAVNF